jgi:mannose/cellobiose epimerase-like protein (N-acyl-D-glucosamine 2-epimerase family)
MRSFRASLPRSLPSVELLHNVMTDMGDPRVPSFGAVISIQNQLLEWLRDHALPCWDRHGVDRQSGGYFENIAWVEPQRQLEASGDVRRGRVVARQLYVFDVAHRLGWRSDLSSPIEHGCDYLFSRMHLGDGIFHTAVDARTHRPSAPFNLYEQAFYLFALARLSATLSDRYPIADTAVRCLERLRRNWGKANGGFEESNPATVPLKSNPHMHLLEAALAWIRVTEGPAQRPWIELARELVSLCLSCFMAPGTGAVLEYFDREWKPATGADGRIIEPGHQFEWAWLLMQWSSSGCVDDAERQACSGAAERLIELGERWGVDPVRGVAINEIWDDMSVKESSAKLWPQTERVKAWCAMFERAQTAAEKERACRKIAAAAEALAKYIPAEPAGLWHETWSSDGSFVAGSSKASSFYHVVCAIDVLRQTVSVHRTSVLYSSSVNEISHDHY